MDSINILKLDLNLLRTFVVLMEERSVSRASERLNLSQSATSNALERIRESFQDRVLVREGRTMVPTRAALRLWPEISRALQSIDSTLSANSRLEPADMHEHFTIGISEYTMALYGKQLVDVIRKAAPHVSLSFTMARLRSYTEQLNRNEVDMLIAPVKQESPELVQQRLFDEDFIGLMSNAHPLAAKKMTLKAYAAYPHLLVSQRGIIKSSIDIALSKEGLQRRVAISIPWFESALGYLAGTDYLLNTGRKLGTKLMQHYPVSKFSIPVEVQGFSIFLLWHPRNTSDVHHRWLRELIIEEIAGEN